MKTLKFAASICLILFAAVLLTPAKAYAAPSGIHTGTKSEIDTNGSGSAYIRVRSLGSNPKRLKVRVEVLNKVYTYDLSNTGSWDTFPLQFGSGKYVIKVFEQIEGTRYSVIQNQTVTASYKNPNQPFLIPTQTVNFDSKSAAAAKARELTKKCKNDLAKVKAIYQFIIKNITYDTATAANVKSGEVTSYIPSPDRTIKNKKGICFDYSSLMAAMLRSVGIPTKVVTGYVSPKNTYHAWNEVYIKNKGWVKVNGSFYFDGVKYSRMDPTFGAGGKNGKLTAYIGNAKNYKVQYVY